MIRAFTLIAALLLTALPAAATEKVAAVSNLKTLYADPNDSRILVLLVSQPGCHFCEQIIEEILEPMLASGLYEDTTLIREIKIYTRDSIRDFEGKKVESTNFAERYDAWATPTLLFLNRNGEQVAEKMIGINTPEFYGYYVDKSLQGALANSAP